MSVNRILLLLSALVFTGAHPAAASDGTGAGATLLELFGLLLAFGCLLVSWRVLSIVRGGKLASAWQWVTSATFAFAAGQALAMLGYLAFIPVTPELVVFLRIAGLVLLLLGMVRMRKALG